MPRDGVKMASRAVRTAKAVCLYVFEVLGPVESFLPPCSSHFNGLVRPRERKFKRKLCLPVENSGNAGPDYLMNKASRTWSRPTNVFEERNFPNKSRISRF